MTLTASRFSCQYQASIYFRNSAKCKYLPFLGTTSSLTGNHYKISQAIAHQCKSLNQVFHASKETNSECSLLSSKSFKVNKQAKKICSYSQLALSIILISPFQTLNLVFLNTFYCPLKYFFLILVLSFLCNQSYNYLST